MTAADLQIFVSLTSQGWNSWSIKTNKLMNEVKRKLETEFKNILSGIKRWRLIGKSFWILPVWVKRKSEKEIPINADITELVEEPSK